MTYKANNRNLLGIPAAVMLATAIVTGPAFTSEARAQTATPNPAAAAAETQQFSDQDLKAYATAMVKVKEIGAKWQEELRTTKDPAASNDIQQKAESEAVAAVKKQGLTVEKYNQIALATETDIDVRNKVLDYVATVK